MARLELVALVTLLGLIGSFPTPQAALASAREIRLDEWAGKPFAESRSYRLVLPEGQPPITGLILALHGQGATPAAHGRMIGLDALAEAAGVAVAYPAALGKPARWNHENCCVGPPLAWSEADFLQAVVADAQQRIGARVPVIAAGFSNGAMLLAAMQCERDLSWVAVILVGGAIFPAGCRRNGSSPLTVFHGSEDPIIPYATVTAGFATLCQLRGCQEAAEVRLSASTACRSYRVDKNLMKFCTITTGGHSWPGGADIPQLGRTIHDFDLSAWLVQQFHRGK